MIKSVANIGKINVLIFFLCFFSLTNVTVVYSQSQKKYSIDVQKRKKKKHFSIKRLLGLTQSQVIARKNRKYEKKRSKGLKNERKASKKYQKSHNQSKEAKKSWKVYSRMKKNERISRRVRNGKSRKTWLQKLFSTKKRRKKRVKQN